MDKITKVELLDEQGNSLKLLVFKKFKFFYVYGLAGYDDENYHNLYKSKNLQFNNIF